MADAALAAAAWACDRHRLALYEALADWRAQPQISSDALENDPALRRLTDQILYRFTKLQDAMGERLVPATLAWLRAPQESWPMRDKLDRLEKLGYLDVGGWLHSRGMCAGDRPRIPGTADLRHAAVLAALVDARLMVQAFGLWQAQLTPPQADPG